MDKQKQIEEMQKDIAVRMAMAKGVAGSMNNGVEGWLGEYLVKMGWIKPTENAVVLTKEAYENIGIYTETVQEYECDENGQPVLVKERKEVKKIPTDIAEFIRKETAEKFAERLKVLVADRLCPEDYDWEDVQVDGPIFVECVDEIAKEIIGETK